MFLFLFKWYIHFFFFKYEKVTMAGLASSDICQQNHAFKILMKLVKIISTVAVDDDIDDVCRFRFSQLTTASPRGPLTREHLRRLRLFASNICLCGNTSNNFNLRKSGDLFAAKHFLFSSNILNLARFLLSTIAVSAREMNSCWGQKPSVHKIKAWSSL